MNKRIMKMIVLVATFLFIMPFYKVSAQSSKYYNVTRLSGQDRYETSFNIASQVNPGVANSIIIASGKNFPDSLVGAPLSKKLNAPILLVDDFNSGLVYKSLDYISKHLSENGTIYLLGGVSSVGNNVVKQLQQSGYSNIKRLGGTDRFDTNNIIVNQMSVKNGTPVVIVNGFNFPDALSISGIAASKGYPIFMSNANNIPQSIVDKISSINPSKVYMIGGTAVLSDNVKNKLKSSLSGIEDSDIIRINGKDRYDTSLQAAKYFKLDSKYAILSNGRNFPDALSGSALAAKLNAPIILTDGKNISNQKNYIDSSDYSNVVILGGQGSVSLNAENNFNGIKLDIGGTFKGEKIIDLKTMDINNDGKIENMILTNNPNDKYNVKLYLQDASNGQIFGSKVVGDSYFGYGQIMLADMTGDGLPEIISVAQEGGNTGNETCDVETVEGNNLTKIDNYNDGENPKLESNISQDNVSFQLNGYDELEINSNNFNKSYSIDLTNDQGMQSAKENGIDVQPYISDGPIYSLYNIDGSGISGLKMSRYISGSCHADSLGGFDAYYKYENSGMKLTNIDFNSRYPMTQN
ncbi:MAG: cell wall-binding repeat-containing protein [Clostridium tyrobutyricum]|jgi:putative cell wall-binding protein|uniref:cell wall-binding repeat-containing protein n=1 Tax=Clostridium tyrobutyricum TaxID=1519 RepID=UPI00073D8BBA|nr:cell wall-binding repeat-containing protein [Clostridium tyrobutyricum]MCH4198711.1 cell wall-binding repeat-containing protein [Clostridium tyrobutyricum]MCH4238078.1 cell wall-binding repeat-containing protein [Clostridium tyrobutyricum]MCH4257448.1 cell wall-binding repeat-containing protein [Clostridium tyrobutyricum]MCI1238282.1 cell wall-binding repeat-containing protein [Clostridium tyrobutyricum]MCI1651995.1 cell wall-binding repeat-containing protein [Clostridium tyrobutyricum]